MKTIELTINEVRTILGDSLSTETDRLLVRQHLDSFIAEQTAEQAEHVEPAEFQPTTIHFLVGEMLPVYEKYIKIGKTQYSPESLGPKQVVPVTC